MSPEIIQHFTDKEFYPGSVVEYKLDKIRNICTIQADNDVVLQLHIISDNIFRFRYSPDGYFQKDFSYALSEGFKGEINDLKLLDTGQHIEIHTAALVCKISRNNMGVTILDKADNILNEDEKGFHWERNQKHGGYIVQMTKKVQRKEVFYGLGDKPTDMNLKGKRFMNWGTDHYGYSKNSDPLYKSIPIYYGLHSGLAYGIFFDNTFKAYFDFGSERNSATSFWAQGGEMNYYFIAGPTLLDACARYTLLTGTPEMPPLWALGFQQCKWSYFPESKVMEVADKMRELEIPCDAIYLDIDYMDGFRCFTWDKEKFPQPKAMVEKLKNNGFKTMVIIDPGIKIDKTYSVFTEALEKGYFCKRPDGDFVEGKVWPGDCYFPDFTKPEVREWWAGLYEELIREIGVAGVWNDMNEPALFEVESKTFPIDVMHDYDGNLCSHRKAHNVYGMQMARATADGVKRFSDGKRSLIITRSGYAGLQRYSSVWTGDNIASWEHLWLADVQAQRLAISGVSFCGSDIGGFIEQPSGELFVRWIQLGIFHPFCRVHSSGDHGDQEPWSFGDKYTQLFKKFVELRYQLLPYLYTSFYNYHKKGIPMIQPIVFYDQDDENNFNRDHEFLCGPNILVVPVMNDKAQSRNMYLPNGLWYNYWDDSVLEGKQELNVGTKLDTFPFFVKAGTVLPLYPVQQYTDQISFDTIDLNVYFTEGSYTSEWYEDDHDGYGYENGEFRLAKFVCHGSQDKFMMSQTIDGHYNSKIMTYKLNMKGLPFTVNSIEVDGQVVQNLDGDLLITAAFKTCIIK
jgi:alpha-glucosidase